MITKLFIVIHTHTHTVCDVQDEEQGDQDCIYLCGQSLGLCPKSARQNVLKVMDNWASLGVHTHTEGYDDDDDDDNKVFNTL